MKTLRLQAGLIALLVVLLAGTVSALPDDDQTMRDLPTFYHDNDLVQRDIQMLNESLPDFLPGISAPKIVKLERDDSIRITNVALLISNIGTADYIYDGVNKILCTAEVGTHSENTSFMNDLAVGETLTVLTVTIERNAREFGIDTSNYQLPLDVDVGITVNSNMVTEELDYQNNRLTYPVRITAPDLAVEIVAPRYTTPASETAIGIRVTNHGEVGSNAAPLHYSITRERDAKINVPALGVNESVIYWQNRTFTTGDYQVHAEINRNGDSDYETTFSNNRANVTISSYRNPTTRIELPRNLVLVPGTTYDLPITVSGASDLADCQVDLAFNDTVLEVESIIPGSLEVVEYIGNGRVSFNGTATSGVSGNVTIATIRFTATGTTGDETALNLDAKLRDVNALPIPVEVVSGSVHLLLYGDANEDGEVNQADTLKVLRLIIGTDKEKPGVGTPQFLATDVNQNGVIDVGDAMFIAQYNAKLRDVYFRLT
jgi:hypothetical protein